MQNVHQLVIRAVHALRRLNRRQWALLLLVLIIGVPVGGWLWNSRPRPPVKFWRPLLPYGVLRVGIDPSYPPFALDFNGELSGLDVDLARAVAEEMDVPMRFVPLGYDGLYDALTADQADVLFSALIVDPLRAAEVRYTDPYFDAGQVLVRPPRSGLETMRDLDGLTIAVEFGAAGDVEARRWQRRLAVLHVAAFDSAGAALDAAARGEADAALVDATSARLWLGEHPGTGLAAAQEYVVSDPYAAAVRVDDGRLWTLINAALESLRADGRLDAIIDRWL